VAGAPGGAVSIVGAGSTAGDATITAHGGTVPGASGGVVAFSSAGHAGRSTIVVNGGTGGGGGASLVFSFGGFGDLARVVLNAGGTMNLANNGSTNTAIGSLEGAGTAILSSTLLTVGALDSSTMFSGPITGPGGRLTKVGAGALTLAGTNTYSGLTTVQQGKLIINGSLAGDTVVKNGGTLGGTGTIKNLVIEPGGVLDPGLSPGTLTVSGLTLMSGATLEYEFGATRDHIVVTNNGNVTLGGMLDITLLGDFNPAAGETFPLFEGAIASITGAFSAVSAPIFNGHTLNLVYSSNQVTLQVIDAILLPGDYNGNGIVDAADYVVWRNEIGTQAAYDTWRANFGAMTSSPIGAALGPQGASFESPIRIDAAVPEPGTGAMMLGALCLLALGPARRQGTCRAANAYRSLPCLAPRTVLFALLAIHYPHLGGSASGSSWTNPGVGNWFVASNWSGGVLPSAMQIADCPNRCH
jgi:autotransporter-associated beta strand protein